LVVSCNYYFSNHCWPGITSFFGIIFSFSIDNIKTFTMKSGSKYSGSKKSSGSNVLLGVLAGAATGAILGVLFAPDKGEETRRKISEGGRDLSDNLKGKVSDLKANVADKYQTVKQSASDLIEQGKAKASDLASNLKSEAGSVASRASDATKTTAGTSGFGAGAAAAASDF
jgi:gas vesicle protein